jgi:hypothetical protein
MTMNFSTTILMKRMTLHFKLVLAALLIVGTVVSAQIKPDKMRADTTKASVDTFLNEELNRNLSNPNSLSRDFSNFSNHNFSVDTTSLWLQTRMMIGEPLNDDPMKTNFNASVLNPLRQQFSDMESMKVLNYILATVEAGAVGYLAYEHIKKFGFFKKK